MSIPGSMNESVIRHRWQPLAWMLGSVFGGLTLLGWMVSGNVGFLVFGIISIAVIPFLAREFLKSVEKIAPIMIQVDGIHAYDGFGVRAFVRWQDIRRIQKMVLW